MTKKTIKAGMTREREMTRIEIKAHKQNNGLYGIPVSCHKIDRAVLLSTENELKHSAILNAIAQNYKDEPFEVFWSNTDGFMVDIKGHGFLKIRYNEFKLNDNTLTWKQP